jgi:hypothetical protein
LPHSYTPDLYKQKCSAVFEYFYEGYYEGYRDRGANIYPNVPTSVGDDPAASIELTDILGEQEEVIR